MPTQQEVTVFDGDRVVGAAVVGPSGHVRIDGLPLSNSTYQVEVSGDDDADASGDAPDEEAIDDDGEGC